MAPTLAGCKAIIHQHLDTTLTLMIAGHRVGHYSAEGKLLTPLTKKQIKAVEKTLRGKVQKQTFPLNLQIPQTTRDSHFPTASTATTEYLCKPDTSLATKADIYLLTTLRRD